MKEMVEEYGMTAIAVYIILILISILPKLKLMYLLGGELFLNSIGG